MSIELFEENQITQITLEEFYSVSGQVTDDIYTDSNPIQTEDTDQTQQIIDRQDLIKTIQEQVDGAIITYHETIKAQIINNGKLYNPKIIRGTFEGGSFISSISSQARIEIFPETDQTIGIAAYNESNSVVFKVHVAGDDVGDVIIGNYAGGQGAKWDQSAGTFIVLGTVTASSIHIPNITTDNSFHTDTEGNSWWGCNVADFADNNDNALAYILKTGQAKFQKVLIGNASNYVDFSVVANGVLRISADRITVGTTTKQVEVGDDIQAAIDEIHALGGGRIILKNGEYDLTDNLVLYSNIYLEGENRLSTILDFQSGAYGIVVEGSDAYTTGTIAINAGSTSVTGTTTVWTTDMIGQKILLGGIWYPIANVNEITQVITISIPYAGTNLSGTSYTIATTIEDVWVKNLTIENSTTSAIKFSYGNESYIYNVSLIANTIGVDINSSSNISLDNIDGIYCGTGMDLDDFHYFFTVSCGFIDITGNGVEITSCTNGTIIGSFISYIGGDGVQITSSEKIVFNTITIRQCGGQGVELISGNSIIVFNTGDVSYNVSDGIKLTATSDNCVISNCVFIGNGGYGWNIAASSCDNNVISTNQYSSNVSGDYFDSGTSTVIYEQSIINVLFGDGSDGDITVNSDSFSSGPITNNVLTRDAFFNNLTVNDTRTLYTGGYRIFVKGTLLNNGTISRAGNNGANAGAGNGAGGAALANGFLGGSAAGGNGEVAGSNASPSLGGSGGAGGFASGSGAGAAGGTATAPAATQGSFRIYPAIMTLYDVIAGTRLLGGAGGGGGGKNPGQPYYGGGGGSGGGVVAIIAKTIINNGTITAKGGNGGNYGPDQEGGGGGGGGGGFISFVYNKLTNNGTITVAGGTGGTGYLGAATNGSAGNIYYGQL